MKKSSILVVLVLSISALAAGSKEASKSSQLTNLLAIQTKSTDAVDSALTVLQDLKQANTDQQSAADQLNASQQEECSQNIEKLKEVVQQNNQVAEDATAHREFIDEEISQTQNYINWISDRVDSINNKRDQLEESRCVSNAFFIRALKEHSEAMEVIDQLKKELQPFTTEAVTNLSQVKTVTDKLKAYSLLYNTQALRAFNQLSQTPQAQDVDNDLLSWNTEADDNNQGELKLEAATDGSSERNVQHSLGDKLVDLLDKLKLHLKDSIDDLTKNEIQSAWDLATWLHHSELELDHLANETQRKQTYLEKLNIAHQSAKAHEDQSWQIHNASVSILNQYLLECEAKHNKYVSETARRNNENNLLDEILQIFEEKVSTLGNNLRDRVDDYEENQNFDNTEFKRGTDDYLNAY
ncbi:hypothetical protein ABPG72_000595 [Tetrahymena utriculariae]